MSREDDSVSFWEEAAAGWARHQGAMRQYTAPLSRRLVEEIKPQPGHVVLELAAGMGETGFLAAELISPGGRLICSDQAEAMLAGARERAAQLGLSNVEFKQIGAEWIDMPVASADAILCRFGLMLMPDPAAALRECRRVLLPGGRIALAVWDAQERNPWSLIPSRLLSERGLGQEPRPGALGPFALGDERRVRELLEGAGFQEVEVQSMQLSEDHPDFDSFWERRLDLSRGFHDAVMGSPEAIIEALRAELRERLGPFTAQDGSLAIPARVLIAMAGA